MKTKIDILSEKSKMTPEELKKNIQDGNPASWYKMNIPYALECIEEYSEVRVREYERNVRRFLEEEIFPSHGFAKELREKFNNIKP